MMPFFSYLNYDGYSTSPNFFKHRLTRFHIDVNTHATHILQWHYKQIFTDLQDKIIYLDFRCISIIKTQ